MLYISVLFVPPIHFVNVTAGYIHIRFLNLADIVLTLHFSGAITFRVPFKV